MYDWPEVRWATDALWAIVAACLKRAGIDALPALERSRTSNAVWIDPGLVLSQTCGWPYVTRLAGQVHLLGTPVYAVMGCSGPLYSSAIISRSGEGASLSDFAGRRAGVNGRDSMSGYIAFLDALRSVALGSGDVAWEETGSHRASVLAVADGKADIAAIDAVCWALAAAYEPRAVATLQVVAWTPLRPGLPLITSRLRTDDEVARIRDAVAEALQSDAAQEACAALHLRGVVPLSDSDYAPLRALSAGAP